MSFSSEKYYIETLNESNSKHLELLFKNSNDIGFFHDIQLNAFYAKKDKAENNSFIIFNLNEKLPVLYCPLFINKIEYNKLYKRNKLIAQSYYTSGPVFYKKIGDKKKREILSFLNSYLIQLSELKKIDKITLSSSPLCKTNISVPQIYTNPLHELRGSWQNIPLAFYYLSLSKTEEDLLNNLETRTRTIITKFLNSNPFHIIKASDSNLNDYYSLYLKTQKRNNMPFHDIESFKWILNFKNSNCYIAYKNSIPACTINIGTFENTAIYWSSFTDETFLKDEIATYLLWFSIIESKRNGIEHFELGDQPFLERGNKFDTIASFKRSYGGELRYKFYSVFERKNKVKKLMSKIIDVL